MKTKVESVKMAGKNGQVFSQFSENEILSPKFMNCIRGGDGGEDVWVPPPPKP